MTVFLFVFELVCAGVNCEMRLIVREQHKSHRVCEAVGQQYTESTSIQRIVICRTIPKGT